MKTTNYSVAVGEILKDKRRRKGYTQCALGTRAHVKQSIISLVESGRRVYSLNALARVAAALETPLSTIMKEAEAITCEGTKDQSSKLLRELRSRLRK